MSASKHCIDNATLQRRLSSIEGQFLDATLGGPKSLAAFVDIWSTLQKDVATGMSTSMWSADTMTLAETIATHISVLVKSFLDIEATTASRHSILLNQCQDILVKDFSNTTTFESDVSLPPSHRSPKPYLQSLRHPTSVTSAFAQVFPSRNPSSAISITESTRSASDPNPLPEFIEHAYKFFVTNIFNPYPTREEKQAIVDKTNNSRVTMTSISNWFTNARRRCGWAEILKRRCNGNREEMVDLAKRVFVKTDTRRLVDPRVVSELMEMKQNVESMYERKTRTSAWIENLEDLDELINPISEEDRLAMKKRETDQEREARRRVKEMQKEQRDFERQKQKMQVEALRKADKVAKKIQREQEEERQMEGYVTSFASPYSPNIQEESVAEPRLVAGGKRKLDSDDASFHDFSGLRHVSSVSSLSSSFISDVSSEGRVPSLTWSDSGDERPYKRSRSSPTTPESRLSPALEIPTSFDYSFTFEPPAGLVEDPSAFDMFDFSSVNPSDTVVNIPKTPLRGQKRHHEVEDGEPTPRAKRVKPIVSSDGPELTSTPILASPGSLFTPTPSVNGTTPSGRRQSSLIDLNTVLGLDHSNPQPVQITPPDASIPLEVGVFDWSTCSNPGVDTFGNMGAMDPQADFSQLFQLFSEQLPSSSQQYEAPQQADLHLDVSSFNLQASDFLSQHPIPPAFPSPEQDEPSLDLSGLMSGLMTDEAFNDIGLEFSNSVPSTPHDLSRSSTVSPAWTPTPMTPVDPSPTPTELADKALSKERKRRELEEKKAVLERERARLAELERELEDD
ncbi:hypothetical protein K439DRAFT_1662201 [Ramaria rubella]|nr:hypothetical protein K439DRAFT_1662201 [Ramaria rubella]